METSASSMRIAIKLNISGANSMQVPEAHGNLYDCRYYRQGAQYQRRDGRNIARKDPSASLHHGFRDTINPSGKDQDTANAHLMYTPAGSQTSVCTSAKNAGATMRHVGLHCWWW